MDKGTFCKLLADNIRMARMSAGMTQFTLAQKIGVKSAARISQYENAKRMPSIMILSIMSKAFGVSVDDMVPDVDTVDITCPDQMTVYDMLGE